MTKAKASDRIRRFRIVDKIDDLDKQTILTFKYIILKFSQKSNIMSEEYLLIPLNTLDSLKDLSEIRSKGKIVQTKSIGEFVNQTGLRNSDIAIQKFIKEGYKLVKYV